MMSVITTLECMQACMLSFIHSLNLHFLYPSGISSYRTQMYKCHLTLESKHVFRIKKKVANCHIFYDQRYAENTPLKKEYITSKSMNETTTKTETKTETKMEN